MRPLITLLLLAAFALFSQAEEVEVFACDTKTHDIEWAEEGTTHLEFHRVGKLVGKIETGKISLGQFAAEAGSHDSSSDPFWGPGVNYLVKAKEGQYFIVFFEYEDGHQTFNGFRMAINKVSLIDPKLGVYVGSPYVGTSFDKNILLQLKDLTQKRKAE